MIERDRKKSGWPIAVAVVVMALLACGLLISLAAKKNAEVEKIERKLATPSKTLAKPAPEIPLPPDE